MALLPDELNHTTAPVELREQVAFDASAKCFVQLTEQFRGVREAILSTCNRTELFCD